MPPSKEVVARREVAVPAERCYQAFSVLEDFPRWFDHLASVRRSPGNGKESVWAMRRPDGKEFTWRVEVTQARPPSLFAWASVGDRMISYGSAEFEPRGPGATRITFRRMHALAKGQDDAILRASPLKDPQAKLEADLERFVRHLASRAGPVKPVEAGGFMVGAPSASPPAAPVGKGPAPPAGKPPARPPQPPSGRVSFQRLGTTEPGRKA